MKIDELELEVSKLHLEPDDILIFKTPQSLRAEQMREIQSALEDRLGTTREIFVLAWGCDISTLIIHEIKAEYARIADDFNRALKALE